MMWRASNLVLGLTVVALANVGLLQAADSKVSSADDTDYKIQGEYTGKLEHDNQQVTLGLQVIALGDGKFHAVAYGGGLPGDGWDGFTRFEADDGQLKDGKVVFGSEQDTHGEIKDGVVRVFSADGAVMAELKKVDRKSPKLGAKPPAGAVVLFDGSSPSEFEGGRMTPDGLLIAGATSKRVFQDCQLHVEFLLPFMPASRGQGRGNSGCYLQGRYEVQMLDSFGLKGENNECGGIYSIKAPDVNMCYPPLTWQTYDIDYTAAKFADGKKVKNATMTVKHNGVLIHKNVELPNVTTAAPRAEGPEPGPIYLQDHGNPVRYRNIWVAEKK